MILGLFVMSCSIFGVFAWWQGSEPSYILWLLHGNGTSAVAKLC